MDDAPLSEKHARILRKYKPVCICNGIRFPRVEEAIQNGARSLSEVARDTGCTTGSCHGERCVPVILEMLDGKR